MRSRISDRDIVFYLVSGCGVLYLLVFIAIIQIGFAHGASVEQLFALHHFDTGEYTSLGQTLATFGRFAPTPAGPPEFFRAPGYPAFLAVIYFLFSSFIAVPLIQIAFTAAAGALIYLIGIRYFTRGVAITAAVFYMLDPIVIFETWAILSETLFMLLFLGAVYVLGTDTRRSWTPYALAGLLLGAVALARPVGPFLAPLIACMAFAHVPVRRALKGIGIMLVVMALVILPWMVRNYALSGHFAISSQQDVQLFEYSAPLFEGMRTNVSWTIVQQQLEDRLGTRDPVALNSFTYAHQERQVALQIIGAHPFEYALFHLEKSAELFVGSSITFVKWQAYVYGLTTARPSGVGAYSLLNQGEWGAAITHLLGKIPELIERLLWLLIYAGALYATIVAVWRRTPNAIWIVCAFILINAVALLAGPVSDDTRYRMPAEPFLLLLAASAASALLQKVSVPFRKVR